jgi:hypothetical protein
MFNGHEKKFRDDPKTADESIDEVKALLGRLRAANDPDDLLRRNNIA